MQRQSQVDLVQLNDVQNDDDGSVETVAKLDADNDADCADQQQSNRNDLIDDVSGASGNTKDAALNKKQAGTEDAPRTK